MSDEMTEELAPVPGLPNFILATPDSQIVQWWQPHRTGDNDQDYENDAACFDAAVSAARLLEGNPQHVLASVLSAMRGVGAIERGFIDRLAAKAAYARIPAPASDYMVTSAVELAGHRFTVESIRAGESYAREMIEVARLADAPFLIADDIADIVQTGGSYGSAGYVWTICAAAGAGAAN